MIQDLSFGFRLLSDRAYQLPCDQINAADLRLYLVTSRRKHDFGAVQILANRWEAISQPAHEIYDLAPRLRTHSPLPVDPNQREAEQLLCRPNSQTIECVRCACAESELENRRFKGRCRHRRIDVELIPGNRRESRLVNIPEDLAPCAEHLVGYKHPKRVFLVDAILKTPANKVDRKLLAEIAIGLDAEGEAR